MRKVPEFVRISANGGPAKRETPKAILVGFGDHEVWLPKSQVHLEESERSRPSFVVMPWWLATKTFTFQGVMRMAEVGTCTSADGE